METISVLWIADLGIVQLLFNERENSLIMSKEESLDLRKRLVLFIRELLMLMFMNCSI